MKKYNLALIEDNEYRKYYENECIFMKQLDHPNVCKLYNTFKDGDIIYMIMEFMDNGDLFTFINANMKLGKRIKEDKLWNIFEQCLKGLVYIHSVGLIHRDIKPANLLLNNEGQVKLSDFNVSALENQIKANNFTKDTQKKEEIINQMTQVGSGNFQAPEVQDSAYDYKIDVYSMGITFCSLAFYTVEIPPNPYGDIYSRELIDIILQMITPDKRRRPSSIKIYNNFIKVYVEKYLHSTGLKSVINCITLYDSFVNFFRNEGDNIGPLNKISKQFNLIIKSLIQRNEMQNLNNLNNSTLYYNNPEYKSLNYLIFEFRELLYENGIKKNEDGSNEIEPISIISFLLKKLHEELNTKKALVGKGNFFKKIVKRDNLKLEAYENFIIFYNNNFQSIISDNFFGLIKTKRICFNCKKSEYFFNMFNFISFNVKILLSCYQNKNNLNIYDAFDCLNKSFITLDVQKCVNCNNCKTITEHREFKQFFNLPKNLIILFDRGENNKYKTFIDFPENLALNNKYVECFNNNNNIIYTLLGIICRIENRNNSSRAEIQFMSFAQTNSNCYVNLENNQQYYLYQIKK